MGDQDQRELLELLRAWQDRRKQWAAMLKGGLFGLLVVFAAIGWGVTIAMTGLTFQ